MAESRSNIAALTLTTLLKGETAAADAPLLGVYVANGITVNAGDIEIGAVELKDATTDTRAVINAANTARTNATNALVTQGVDAAGRVLQSGASQTAASAVTAASIVQLVQPINASGEVIESPVPSTIRSGSRTLATANVAQQLASQYAQGTITVSTFGVAGQTFTIGTQTFTWAAVRAVAGEVSVGASAAEAVTNIVSAITLDIPAEVTAIDGTGDTVVVTAVAGGVGGNAVAFVNVDSANLTFNGAGTLGATTLAVAITDLDCKHVFIKADTANTGTVTIGGLSGQNIPITAGGWYEFDIDLLSTVYLKSTVGGDGVTYNSFN